MNTAERRALAALSSIPGIGPVAIAQLETAPGGLGALLESPVRSWELALNARMKRALLGITSLAVVADTLERRLRVLRHQVVYQGDLAWPLRLNDGAPRVLFMDGPGAVTGPRRRVGIVGTRHPEPGACDRIRELANDLAQAQIRVVSGAAEGIDQAAHLGALDGAGETWAFLGSSIDQMDRPQRQLAVRLRAEGGTFFSQFAPGVRADQSTFTRRNPLIARASDAVLIARAPSDSGSLYTAEAARELRVPMLVTPGDPWNRAAVGSNSLLKKGLASVCLGADDLLEALGLTQAVSRVASTRQSTDRLSGAAREVLEVLERHASDVDLLASQTRRTPDEVVAALSELEIEGCALQRGAGQWERV